MPRFSSAESQAEHAVKQKLSIGKSRHSNRNDQKIYSLGTARNYIQVLTQVARWIQINRFGDLGKLTKEQAITYLEYRGQEVRQKTLDQERQAIQIHLGLKLPVVKSELQQTLSSRAYTAEQIEMVASAQTDKNRLATKIVQASGIRAHELLTLQRKEDQAASTHRQWSEQRFQGRDGVIYTVSGKGGLIREVLIPKALAAELESKRLTMPITIKDREIIYKKYYDIAGGKNWSNSFSTASKRALGWSNGGHGLRHSYAQTRMDELQGSGLIYYEALGIVSQELGHFRPDITEVYLR